MFETIPGLTWVIRADGTWLITLHNNNMRWTLNNSAGVIWSLFLEGTTAEAASERLAEMLGRGDKSKINEVVKETARILQEHQLLRPTLGEAYSGLRDKPFPVPELSVETSTQALRGPSAACNCNIISACNCATL